MAALGLRYCALTFFSCGEWDLLVSVHSLLLWSTGAQAVGEQASVVAPQDVESSRIRDGTHVPCIGRWILIHWAPREVLIIFLTRMFWRQIKVASTGRLDGVCCLPDDAKRYTSFEKHLLPCSWVLVKTC